MSTIFLSGGRFAFPISSLSSAHVATGSIYHVPTHMMKLPLLIASLAAVILSVNPCSGQTTTAEPSKQTVGSLTDPFSGRIVFHQKVGHVIYDVTIEKGLVSGHQLLDFDPKPIADIVGGWFDYKKGRLSLLVQGTAEGIDPRWRSQAQHFSIDPKTREVTLEHMLYDYGSTLDTSEDTPTAHILDSLNAAVHLVN